MHERLPRLGLLRYLKDIKKDIETHSSPGVDTKCSTIQRYDLSSLNEAERQEFIDDNVTGPYVWIGNTLSYSDRFITDIDSECPENSDFHFHYYTEATDGAGDHEGDRWIGTPDPDHNLEDIDNDTAPDPLPEKTNPSDLLPYYDHEVVTPQIPVDKPVHQPSIGVRSPVTAPMNEPQVVNVVEVVATEIEPMISLRITALSFEDIPGRSRILYTPTLSMEITSYSDNQDHDMLVLNVNIKEFQTPTGFFESDTWINGDIRKVKIESRPRNYAVFLRQGDKRYWSYKDRQGIVTISRFDLENFTISIIHAGITIDTVTQDDFDSDGNRIGFVRAAPSMIRTTTGLWANFKRSE